MPWLEPPAQNVITWEVTPNVWGWNVLSPEVLPLAVLLTPSPELAQGTQPPVPWMGQGPGWPRNLPCKLRSTPSLTTSVSHVIPTFVAIGTILPAACGAPLFAVGR